MWQGPFGKDTIVVHIDSGHAVVSSSKSASHGPATVHAGIAVSESPTPFYPIALQFDGVSFAFA